MMGETIPKETNTVSLDSNLKDEWGIPQLKIDIGYDDVIELFTARPR